MCLFFSDLAVQTKTVLFQKLETMMILHKGKNSAPLMLREEQSRAQSQIKSFRFRDSSGYPLSTHWLGPKSRGALALAFQWNPVQSDLE